MQYCELFPCVPVPLCCNWQAVVGEKVTGLQSVSQHQPGSTQPLPPIMELSFSTLHAGVVRAQANGNLVVRHFGQWCVCVGHSFFVYTQARGCAPHSKLAEHNTCAFQICVSVEACMNVRQKQPGSFPTVLISHQYLPSFFLSFFPCSLPDSFPLNVIGPSLVFVPGLDFNKGHVLSSVLMGQPSQNRAYILH